MNQPPPPDQPSGSTGSQGMNQGLQVLSYLIAGIGVLAAWYGVKLCLLNRTLATPGLEINLAVLYASSVAGGVLLVIYAVSMIVAPPPPDTETVPLEVRAE